MKEYIERTALGIGKCNPNVFEDKGYAKGWNAAIDIIQNAPAADVREVVRCKDCKNADYSGMGKGSVWCNEMERAISEDGWCFKGDKEIEMPIVRGNNAI